MRSSALCSLLLLMLAAPLSAQMPSDWSGTNRDDFFHRMNTGEITLRFSDALTGEPVVGAEVRVDTLLALATDAEGKVRFGPIEDGHYTLALRHDGYIEADFPIRVLLGRVRGASYSLSPVMELGHLRAVLDWGESPRDLDLHFIKRGSYHISYRDKRVSEDGIAQLDRDDTDGYGPETATCSDIDEEAVYEVWVHDYSNKDRGRLSKELSEGGATVTIYADNALAGVVTIPAQTRGVWWKVLTIDGAELLEINQLSATGP